MIDYIIKFEDAWYSVPNCKSPRFEGQITGGETIFMPPKVIYSASEIYNVTENKFEKTRSGSVADVFKLRHWLGEFEDLPLFWESSDHYRRFRPMGGNRMRG